MKKKKTKVKMVKTTKKKRPDPKVRLTLINLKVTKSEKKILARLAYRFANGNLSLWLRKAGKDYRPIVKKSIKK